LRQVRNPLILAVPSLIEKIQKLVPFWSVPYFAYSTSGVGDKRGFEQPYLGQVRLRV